MRLEDIDVGMRVEIARERTDSYWLREGIALGKNEGVTEGDRIRIRLDDSDFAEIIGGHIAANLERA